MEHLDAPLGSPAEGALPGTVPEPTLRTLLDEFIESRSAENTRMAYRKALDDFLAELGLETLAAFLAVQTVDVVRYRNALQKRRLAAPTINQRLVAVRGTFGRLVKEGRIGRNPADAELVGNLKVSDVSKTEGLSLEEIE